LSGAGVLEQHDFLFAIQRSGKIDPETRKDLVRRRIL